MVDGVATEIRANHVESAVKVDGEYVVLASDTDRRGGLLHPAFEHTERDGLPIQHVDRIGRVVVQIRSVHDGRSLEDGAAILWKARSFPRFMFCASRTSSMVPITLLLV